MASVFVHHVIGDLTVGKPEIKEFADTETVEAAVKAIGECAEGAITVWKAKDGIGSRASRFVGILHSMDLVVFLAKAGEEHERAMRTPVAEVVTPNPMLLKEVDPGTRLIDALELMKQGVRRLLVRKSMAWKGVSKRFSILYNGKWLKTLNTSTATATGNSSQPSSSSYDDKYCCLSREDVVRFLIGCLGALAPIPLSSISSLGAITPHYFHIEASSPAIEVVHKLPQDPCAIVVVETNPDGSHKIIGEISAYKLWKCDYLAAAWALANLSAGQFVMGAEDNITNSDSLVPSFSIPSSPVEDTIIGASSRPKKFSSRSIGFFSSQANQMAVGGLRSMYRGRSAPLTCKHTSSLAAVMAQMLSHRATHVWVTDAEVEDILIGIIGYSDILHAVTRHPSSLVPPTP
ncbi:CBS domain-containing protein CBSX6 [Dioscorea cayenensis subsp. rotundata]|uniref:CBS domain-containing protein CBSX6 n=1 Tax=Dioscorea cayennensis subsp. rotundata TaxID=55577 RepID=A0AB40B5J1_DIOCR|nr:CBS domain-containing protein CBSX6 [Dioscorea cayenensis subsp. rotundata]